MRKLVVNIAIPARRDISLVLTIRFNGTESVQETSISSSESIKWSGAVVTRGAARKERRV